PDTSLNRTPHTVPTRRTTDRRHVSHRNERHDVGRPHARVLARVLSQVDALGRDAHAAERGFRGMRVATERIDLTQHTGEHPRMRSEEHTYELQSRADVVSLLL